MWREDVRVQLSSPAFVADIHYYLAIDHGLTHEEILYGGIDALAAAKGGIFHSLLTSGDGSKFNPDSATAAAALGHRHQMEVESGEVTCTHAFFRRALEQDDPVRHLLFAFDLY